MNATRAYQQVMEEVPTGRDNPYPAPAKKTQRKRGKKHLRNHGRSMTSSVGHCVIIRIRVECNAKNRGPLSSTILFCASSALISSNGYTKASRTSTMFA